MIPGRYPSYFVYKSNSGHSCSLFDVIWYQNGSKRCGSKIGYFAFQEMSGDPRPWMKILRKAEEIILEHATFQKELPVMVGKGVREFYGEFYGRRV